MSFVNLDGGRLHYELTDIVAPWAANADTVILHHGAAADSRSWSAWLPLLAGDYRVVRFDARGCGRSSAPQPGFDWSLDQLVSDVLDVAQASGVTRFHFVGNGIGGNVGLHLADRYADRLLSLTAINCAADGKAIAGMTKWFSLMESSDKHGWAGAIMANRFHPGEIAPELWSWLEYQLTRDPHAASLNLASMQCEIDMTARLSGIGVPVLLLSADGNPYLPVAHMAWMQSQISGSLLHVIAHSREGLVMSHPEQCARAVKRFIRRFSGRRSLDMPAII